VKKKVTKKKVAKIKQKKRKKIITKKIKKVSKKFLQNLSNQKQIKKQFPLQQNQKLTT
jgi:hypothetical protein